MMLGTSNNQQTDIVVYVSGHGYIDNKKCITIPQNVTVYTYVNEGYGYFGSCTKQLIQNGEYKRPETIEEDYWEKLAQINIYNPKQCIKEHYLTPDRLAFKSDFEDVELKQQNNQVDSSNENNDDELNLDNSTFLQVEGQNTKFVFKTPDNSIVSLSKLINKITEKYLNKNIQLHWTACRVCEDNTSTFKDLLNTCKKDRDYGMNDQDNIKNYTGYQISKKQNILKFCKKVSKKFPKSCCTNSCQNPAI
ncbi:MAG: putative adhesin [Crocosphaera sp.]